MVRTIYIKTILKVLFVFVSVFANSQNTKKWQSLSTPFFSDFKKIQPVFNDTIFIAGKELMVLNQNHCTAFKPQPPCEITSFFALNNHTVFVSNATPYQNSELYKWNGKSWEKLNNPMINNILDMFFIDKNNGVLVAYGEIALLKNGIWKHLNPPTNRAFYKVIQPSKNELFVLALGKGIYRYFNQEWTFIKNSEKVHHLSYLQQKTYCLGDNFLAVLKENQLQKQIKNSIFKSIVSISKFKTKLIGVGYNGRIISIANNKIQSETSNTHQHLQQIINSNNTLWCVGNEGTLLKYTAQKINTQIHTWKGFEKITFNKQAKIIDDEYGVIAADFNNDGWTDIFTTGLFESEHLYINQKNMSFTDQSSSYKLNLKNNNIKELNLSACVGDIDNDGYLDLYITLLNGKNKILKNINGNHFVNYSTISKGIGKSTDRTNGCIMGDVDNDGDLDIFITNEYSTNRLYLNNGVGIFTENTQKAGLTTLEGGNVASFADIDNDGDIDLYVSNWSSKNILYVNQWVETGTLFFKNNTQNANVGGKAFEKSNAVVFTDIDNDADLDLFVSNRKTANRMYINNGDGIFEDKTVTLIGLNTSNSYGTVIADFDGDTYKDIYVSNVGENVFYKNTATKFSNQTKKYEASQKGYSTGAALADFDNDGDVDMYLANYLGESSALFRNKKKDNKHITIQVFGYKNNYNAIGTKIYVYTKKQKKLLWFDEIRAGTGYVSVNDFKKVIPLKNNDSVYVKIIFPNGIIIKKSNITKGSFLQINDVSTIQKKWLQIKRVIKKVFLDPHHFFEFVKWLFVLLLIFFVGFHFKKKYHLYTFYYVISSLFFVGLYEIQYLFLEYQPFLYSTFLPLTSIILLVLFSYYFFEKKYIKKMAYIENTKLKTKLSRNLHDDLGATVSSIGFYLTLMKFNIPKNKKINQYIEISENLLADATNAIGDLIWSINPKSENLKSLLQRIHKNYDVLFKEKNIVFTSQITSQLTSLILNDSQKQNIFLILKETLNNALKYANATKVTIHIKKVEHKIQIIISDNGIGFHFLKEKNKGHGLFNIKKRAEEIHAKMNIKSKKNKGTQIKLLF